MSPQLHWWYYSLGCPDQGFFFFLSHPDPSPLIFTKCRYRVPIPYLYHPLLFSYSLCCHVKWRGCVACIFHTFSIIAYFTCSAVRDPWNQCAYRHLVTRDGRAYWGFKNSRWWWKPRSSTTEMSWLSRAIHLVISSVSIFGHVAVLRTFLCPFESIRECLLLPCLCLYCLSELIV